MRVLLDTNVLISAALSASGTPYTTETQIRDVNDRPILRAAIEAKADVLLTGDKDFLESGVKKPAIMTPAEFLNI